MHEWIEAKYTTDAFPEVYKDETAVYVVKFKKHTDPSISIPFLTPSIATVYFETLPNLLLVLLQQPPSTTSPTATGMSELHPWFNQYFWPF